MKSATYNLQSEILFTDGLNNNLTGIVPGRDFRLQNQDLRLQFLTAF